MTPRGLPVQRRNLLKLMATGGLAGVAGADGTIAPSADSEEECSVHDQGRSPVWIAHNAKMTDSLVRTNGFPRDPRTSERLPKLGRETALLMQSLQYHGSEWAHANNSSGSDRWHHDFSLTTVGLGAIDLADDNTEGICHDVVPIKSINSLDTVIDAGPENCESHQSVAVRKSGEFTFPVRTLGDPGSLFQFRPNFDVDRPCRYEWHNENYESLVKKRAHMLQRFTSPYQSLVKGALRNPESVQGSEIDVDDVLNRTLAERDASTGDDSGEVVVDALMLAAAVAVRSNPYASAALTVAEVARLAADIAGLLDEDGRDDDGPNCDYRGLKHEDDAGGKRAIRIQQIHFAVTTEPSQAVTDPVELRIETDAWLDPNHLSDLKQVWTVPVDHPTEPPADVSSTDVTLFPGAQEDHRRDHAGRPRKPRDAWISRVSTEPIAEIEPATGAPGPLDGSSWPLGTHPEFTADVQNPEEIVFAEWSFEADPQRDHYCEKSEIGSDPPDLNWRVDVPLRHEPRTAEVGVLLQNEAGLTSFETTTFEVTDAPDAVISEPSATEFGLDSTVSLDASESSPSEGRTIESYRWHLVSPEEVVGELSGGSFGGEHWDTVESDPSPSHGHAEQLVATGETASFEVREAIASGYPTMLQLTVEDEAGVEAFDRVQLTFSVDDGSWSGSWSGDAGDGDGGSWSGNAGDGDGGSWSGDAGDGDDGSGDTDDEPDWCDGRDLENSPNGNYADWSRCN